MKNLGYSIFNGTKQIWNTRENHAKSRKSCHIEKVGLFRENHAVSGKFGHIEKITPYRGNWDFNRSRSGI